MIVPQGFHVIYQPKQRIPSVLDLNKRGLFKVRPFVTSSWTYRIIASEDFKARLQYLQLVEKDVTDPRTGQRYSFAVEDRLMDLDENLAVKSLDLATSVADETIREKILTSLEEFRSAYIPLDEHKKTDQERLRKKLLASIAEHKEKIRKALVRKNSSWVNAAIPRLIQDFKRSVYPRVEDRLYEHYRHLGGEKSETELVQKIALFQRIYESDDRDLMRKPNGGIWKDDDEIWECWIGFANGEEEAKRICRTMNAAFRPLAGERPGQSITES